LQRAGFRYVFTKEMQPSMLNFPQPITRWVLERPGLTDQSAALGLDQDREVLEVGLADGAA
jgi:hypothetical protein